MFTPPLIHGLLLAGGKSRRMGKDKAELKIDGKHTMREKSLKLLSDLEIHSFLSIATDDQRSYNIRTIRDRVANMGPLGAIDSAFAVQPDHAWLVIACDMPNLSSDTLKTLIANRDPKKSATCYLSPVDEFPEPLCAIYEPSAASQISEAVKHKHLCARRLLASLPLHGVLLQNTDALVNCNRPEHLEELRLRKKQTVKEKNLTIEFFASLKEQVQEAEPKITTQSATAAGLWDELRLKHGFKHDLDTVRLAINDEFAPWTTKLNDGDHLAFLPPFAGG